MTNAQSYNKNIMFSNVIYL